MDGRELERLVAEGVERMRARRRGEREFEELVREDPETAADVLPQMIAEYRDALRRELREEFGFTVVRERYGYVLRPAKKGQTALHKKSGFWCSFDSPGRVAALKKLERAARWVDLVAALAGYEAAVEAVHEAAVYFRESDQARKMCDAFSDAMRQTPAVYKAFADDVNRLPFPSRAREQVRGYATAMLAAWVRAHLNDNINTKVKEVLRDEDWADELVSAVTLASRRLRADAVIKNPTRFRDADNRRREDGRRESTPAPPDLVNLVDRILNDRKSGRETPGDVGAFGFMDREERLKRARDGRLSRQERQVFEFCEENPDLKYREVADRLGIKSVSQVGVVLHRVEKKLDTA